jgi:hypothetical protein
MFYRLLSLIAIIYCATTSNALAAGKIHVVPAPGHSQPMFARTDATGTIHLVCQSQHGPQYFQSTDGGKHFSEPLAIVDQASRKQPGLEFDVWDMAVTPEGQVHVALGTNAWKLKLPREEWGFFYARLDPKAKEFTPVKNINHTPSEGFSLAAGKNGKLTACWLAGKLYASISDDGGDTFEPAAEIDAELNPCNCCTTSCTYGNDGRLAILYREETNDERNMFLVLWDQEKQKIARKQISTTPWHIDSCPMTYYQVAATASGYSAVWPTKGQVYFTRLDKEGGLLSPKEISTGGQNGMRSGMIALTSSDGKSLVAWKKEGKLGWQLYDKDGKPDGKPGVADNPGSGAAGVVTKDGNFVLFR